MKLAGPGTRLLPAYSQWATAAGRFVGRIWRRGPGGCAPGGAGEERGLAGEARTAVRGWDRGRARALSNLYKNTVATESGVGGGVVVMG